MPLTYNGNSPQKIYYNKNFVDTVKYNGDVVWTYQPPAGYTRVECIETQGYSAWCTTGITADQNTEMEITASNITSTSAQLMVAETNSTSNFRIVKTSADQKIAGSVSSANAVSNSDGIAKFTARLSLSAFYLNGELIGTFTITPIIGQYNIDIFSGKYGSSRYYTGPGSRFYEAIVWKNGIEVFHGFPVKDSSDNYGIYDAISDTFRTSQGSGAFIDGSSSLLSMNLNGAKSGSLKSGKVEPIVIPDPDTDEEMR